MRGITIGVFDVLHIGHKYIIDRLKSYCQEYKLRSCVLTFNTHPRMVLEKKNTSFKPLLSIDKKLDLLKSFGVDEVKVLNFDQDLYQTEAPQFIENFIINELSTKLIVVGEDFRFGRGRKGDINTLKQYQHKFILKVEELKKIEGKKISSSDIRNMIKEGRVKEASNYLGRFYSIEGKVIKSTKRGRKLLKYPTANIPLPINLVLPAWGVYAVKVRLDNIIYSGISNVGGRPTFDELLFIEVFLFSFNRDIYGKNLEVFFIDNIRKQKKFGSIQDLAKQIEKDIEIAKTILQPFYSLKTLNL